MATRADAAAETRRKIFAAARELFAERGYHETTVGEIASKAGVAKGTFFIHFATKDAVASDLVRTQTRAARVARQKTLDAGKGPVAALRACALTLGEQAGTSRELSRAVVAATLASSQVGGAADLLFSEVAADMTTDARAAQQLGLLSRATPAETIASSLVAAYLGAVLHYTTSPRAKPILDVLRPLIDANLAGFVTKEGAPHETRTPRTRKPTGHTVSRRSVRA